MVVRRVAAARDMDRAECHRSGRMALKVDATTAGGRQLPSEKVNVAWQGVVLTVRFPLTALHCSRIPDTVKELQPNTMSRTAFDFS